MGVSVVRVIRVFLLKACCVMYIGVSLFVRFYGPKFGEAFGLFGLLGLCVFFLG